ncbi:MAG: nicotinate-nucleotide adenylyltransferase [Rhodocyclaceae bacterium]|nr:nicotinate-nucleotide adenylyltransferase [Rhodocyclaceae bacterium]MDZ4215991.1 nicotinate-nucleotide adenylyltransferase [Rhodocyclaceae bacterium]
MSDAVGILGGTFDPVHLAHLALARTARDRLKIPEIRWIPVGQPPHRGTPSSTPADRLAMVQATIDGEPGFVLDASEVDSEAPSYTVHTLERLRRELGSQRPLVLLMGADAFHGFARWHRWQDIFGLAHIAVATRPGFPLADFEEPLAEEFAKRRLANADFSKPAGHIVAFELIAGTVSATEVRQRVAAHDPPAVLLELLPPPVLDYIQHHQLYLS